MVNKKVIQWKVLVFCLIVSYATAFIGSLITSPAIESGWYDTVRPSITPPDWVFPVVWNVLFFMIALSLYFGWTSSPKSERVSVGFWFGINLALNVLWTFLYFGMRNPLFAFVEIIFLICSTIILILAIWTINRRSSLLLVPYALWLCFASVLNWLSIP